MNDLHELGRVALLQVAPVVPKFAGPTHELYDPAPLRTVDHVLLSERGVIGVTGHGEQIMDVHHVDHPQSRFRGANGVSVGFTGHYAALRDQFGAHMVDGCAAENILMKHRGKEHWMRHTYGSWLNKRRQDGAMCWAGPPLLSRACRLHAGLPRMPQRRRPIRSARRCSNCGMACAASTWMSRPLRSRSLSGPATACSQPMHYEQRMRTQLLNTCIFANFLYNPAICFLLFYIHGDRAC